MLSAQAHAPRMPSRALVLLSLACGASSAPAPAAAFFPAWASRVPTWAPPAPHTPVFSTRARDLPLVGAAGPYSLPVLEVFDAAAAGGAGGVVAVYIPSSSESVQKLKPGATPELNLLVATPDAAPPTLPPLPRYGWAWLWGAKLVTIPWLDCCDITGDAAGFRVSADGAAEWTLTQWQTWYPNGTHAGRDAHSEHSFTLRFDAAVGYAIDVVAALRINAAAAPKTVELTNFLTPQLINPWAFRAPPPVLGGARSDLTAWSADGGASWTGFAENSLSGAMLRQYNVSAAGAGVPAVVGMFARGARSAVLAFDGTLPLKQMTCPTWADQHQVVVLPAPGADGYVTIAPTFSLAYAPAAAADDVFARAAVVSHRGDGTRGNGTAVILQLGVLEDFSAQPKSLLAPTRGLVQAAYEPDYALVPFARGAGRALAVPAQSAAAAGGFYSFANSLPLVPLNATTDYVAFADALPVAPTAGCAAGAAATLAVSLYEDDDFNEQSDRLLNFSATAPAGAAWTRLVVNFSTRAWVAYADVRLRVVAGDASDCGGARGLWQNFFFGTAADAVAAAAVIV
jgi:hypothetical protein